MTLLAFLAGLLTDIVWAKWHACVSAGRAVAAANWSVGIFGTSVVYTLFVVERDWASVAAYACGAWWGTYLAVRNTKHV